MKSCTVIYNPYSGKKNKEKFLDKFMQKLKENGYRATLLYSKYKGHIMEIVRDLKSTDLVITLGGDGTFNEAMRGNFKRNERLVLAHIPVGTTNDVGKMFGYGKNILKNLDMLLEGEIRNVDICTINKEPFVYVAGFGKFMNIPYETSRNSKKTLGYLAYAINIVKDFFKFIRLHDITYVIDGEEYNGLYSFMLASNATRIAGFNNVFQGVKLNDSKFEVLFCNIKKRKHIIKTLYYLRKTDITHVPGFYFHKTDKIKIKVNDGRKLIWCVDGEKMEEGLTEIEIAIDKNVKIMIPKVNIDELF